MTNKPKVLFVDDDINLLKASRRLLRKDVDLEIANGANEALALMERSGPFDVLVSDQNMPEMKGIALLGEAAKRWPLTVRILLTGNDDQDTAISAVNEGKVFRFVRKPCQPSELLAAIREAGQQHSLLAAEKMLLEKTLSGSVKVLTDVLSLTEPELFKKAMKVQKWARRLAPHLNLSNPWELNLSTMLYPIGMVALPDDVAQRFAAGEELSAEEKSIVETIPATARDLIKNIPRLENVAKTIFYSRKGYDGSGFPHEDVKGEDLPLSARVLHILIDLVDEVVDKDMSILEGLKALANKPQLYDLRLLELATKLLPGEAAPQNQIQVFEKLMPNQLTEGDMVMKPIKDQNGRVLLTSGSELTTMIIKRLKLMQKAGSIAEQIHISRWKEAS